MTDQTYTVDKIVGEPRPWDSKYGPMLSYKLQITGGGLEGAVVELSQKPTTSAPGIGDTLTGSIQPAQDERFPAKFRKAQQAGGFGGGGGGPRPEDPVRQRRIVRQHSQEMAIRFLAACGCMAEMDPADPKDEAGTKAYLATVKRLADFFDGDVESKAA